MACIRIHTRNKRTNRTTCHLPHSSTNPAEQALYYLYFQGKVKFKHCAFGSSGTLASIGARAAGIPYFPASMSLVRHCVCFLCSLRNCIGHNLNCCLCPQCCDTHKFKVRKGWLWAFCQEHRGWGAKSGARQVPRHIFEPGFLELSCTVKLVCHIVIYILFTLLHDLGQGVHCNCSYRALHSPSHDTRRSRFLFSFCPFLWNTSDKPIVVQTQHLPSLVCMCPMNMNMFTWRVWVVWGVGRMLTLLALPRTCPMQPSSLVWWWVGEMLTFFAARTCWMLRICSRVFVGWGDVNVLWACAHMTCSMLRNWWE